LTKHENEEYIIFSGCHDKPFDFFQKMKNQQQEITIDFFQFSKKMIFILALHQQVLT
jgi:hypothetical protein